MSAVKAAFCWSGGKDSSYALYQLQREGNWDIKYLLTTINDTLGRVSMHGVREELLEAQAHSVGIPWIPVFVSEENTEEYEQNMQKAFQALKQQEINHVVLGDIFLEDLRSYREVQLEKIGMKAIFPLWKKDTRKVVNDFLDKGFKTITCCVSDAYFSSSCVGRELNQSFLHELPALVDCCGENGEYHTFCYEGPIFQKKHLFEWAKKFIDHCHQN